MMTGFGEDRHCSPAILGASTSAPSCRMSDAAYTVDPTANKGVRAEPTAADGQHETRAERHGSVVLRG